MLRGFPLVAQDFSPASKDRGRSRPNRILPSLSVAILILFFINTTATAAPFGYVISSAGIEVIDQDTNTVVATVPVGGNLSRVSISPDGSRAYVTNPGSNNVLVINTATNTVVATVPVGTTPNGVSISPDGSTAYVTNAGSNNVSVIGTATNTVTATVPVGSVPLGVGFTPDGSFAYVTNLDSGAGTAADTVQVIRTSDLSVVSTITVGDQPAAVAVSPDGRFAYVTNVGDGPLANLLSVIDTSTNTVVATRPVGADPWNLAFKPDSTLAYISNASSGTVSIVRTSDHTVVGTISGGIWSGGVTTSPDGKFVYLTRYGFGSDAILVIDANTNTVVGTITPTGVTTHSIAGQFSGYPLSVYVAAGAPLAALFDAGFTVAQLLAAGATNAQLIAAGILPSPSVPSSSTWGMIILALFMAISGMWRIRQRTGFFFRVTILLGLFTFIFIVLPLPRGITHLLNDLTAGVASALLQMIGYKVTSLGQFVLGNDFSLKVILQCTGFFEAVVFSACVLAYPTTFTKKLLGLCLGLGIIFCFNIFRIVGVFLIGASYPAYFELFHTYMFYSLSLVLVVTLWIYWMDKVVGQEGLNNKLLCLGRLLLSTVFLTIVWAKVYGTYFSFLITVAEAVLNKMGPLLVTGLGNHSTNPGAPTSFVYNVETFNTSLSVVGTLAFILCLSQGGGILRRIMNCCMALIGLFGLHILLNIFYILGTTWTSDWLIRVGNVLTVGIILVPFVVALALLYRSPSIRGG